MRWRCLLLLLRRRRARHRRWLLGGGGAIAEEAAPAVAEEAWRASAALEGGANPHVITAAARRLSVRPEE